MTTSISTGGSGGLATELVTLLPRLGIGLVLSLVIVVMGIVAAGRTEKFTRRIGLSEAVMETPLGAPFRAQRSVEGFINTVAKYFFYVFALFVFITLAGIDVLNTYGGILVRYFPSAIGGVAVVLVGFVIAGYVGKSIRDSEVLRGSDIAVLGGETAKGVIYLISVTLGLDAFGYSTPILTTLAQSVVIGLGLGIAAAIGISVGLGSQDYVASHIEEWVDGDSED
jgi:hypothetical protein